MVYIITFSMPLRPLLSFKFTSVFLLPLGPRLAPFSRSSFFMILLFCYWSILVWYFFLRVWIFLRKKNKTFLEKSFFSYCFWLVLKQNHEDNKMRKSTGKNLETGKLFSALSFELRVPVFRFCFIFSWVLINNVDGNAM